MSTSPRVAAALARAEALVAAPGGAPPAGPPPPAAPGRVVALGDPQGPAAAVFAVLDHHRLLGPDGWLAADVTLVSIGDHFDFIGADADADAGHGERVLAWLAAHDPRQVVLLLGNHDTARVQELHAARDATFPAARALATPPADRPLAATAAAALRRRFPDLPVAGLVARDYATFRESQRALVQRLLLAGRFHLAAAGRLPGGAAVLLSHAGVTDREVALLGLTAPPAAAIAAALDDFLAARVAAVRAAWTAGRPAPLDLAPLHLAADADGEGGGLLYHRPADPAPDPDAGDLDLAWGFDPTRPRRFDPRTLPAGLVQACGHVRHPSSLRELRRFADAAAVAAPPGALRTLEVLGTAVRYTAGCHPPVPGAAVLYLIDGELCHTRAADYALLTLGAVGAPRAKPPGP